MAPATVKLLVDPEQITEGAAFGVRAGKAFTVTVEVFTELQPPVDPVTV